MRSHDKLMFTLYAIAFVMGAWLATSPYSANERMLGAVQMAIISVFFWLRIAVIRKRNKRGQST